jgi:hypothetical protein
MKMLDPAKKKAYDDAGYNGALTPLQAAQKKVDDAHKAGLANQAAAEAGAAPTATAAPASPTTAAPAVKPLPSVVPKAPDTAGATEAARGQVLETLGAGDKLANELYAPGSLGRVDTPRMAETAALIKAQQNALSGMSPQEQEAARTNAILQINQQANSKLRDISGRAAGNGLRGGVVAGENAQVAGASQGAYASALQDLMGKVQKSQVDASSALGNTFTAARNNEGSAQKTNLAASAAELAGRLSTPFDYANVIDAATTNDRVETNTEAGRIDKGLETDKDMRELGEARDDAIDEAAGDRLKTGDPGVDDAPRNTLARANGVSTFEDLSPELKQEYADAAGVMPDQLDRFMSDPKNSEWVNTMINRARARKNGY